MGINKIESTEILDLLRKTLNGEIEAKLIGNSIALDNIDGIYDFDIGAYNISIFFDANKLDYVDSVVSPDGRKGDYDYWTLHSDGQKDPIDLLSDGKHKRLELLLLDKIKGR